MLTTYKLQTELHRHLDISARTETVLRLAQERGLEAMSTSLESFREKLILREPLESLSSVLGTFTLFQKILDRPEALEQVAYEVVEDCYREGLRRVELRFSPGFVCEFSHLSWTDALAAFEAGIQRALKTYPDMKAGLICIATRDYGPDSTAETVEFFLKERSRFIGLDLAGNETAFPCRLFEDAFKKARNENAKITIHAGEAAGPDSIWEAIERLGAHRIGHGIACIQDPQLMDYLARNQICLEMCPTSNWLTQAVSTLAQHPLPKVLRAGIPVCINTDDPGVFGVSMASEILVCQSQLGMSANEIQECFAHADRASFLN